MESVRIARIGSFYAGGRQIRIEGEAVRDIAFTRTVSYSYDPNGLFHIEQAYVQFFIPERVVSPLPIVLLHGGGFTGAMWETTPDGRPGWLEIFLGLGFSVYVVDNVERGRASWCPFPGVWQGEPIMRSAEECWSLFRFGRAEDFACRKPFPGQRFPIDRLEELIKGCVPRWLTNNDVAAQTFTAVLERVGPCCVISHSHGGEVAFRAAAARPALVPCLVAVEPSGFADDPAAFANRRVLVVTGDFMDATPVWISLFRRTGEFVAQLTAAGCDAAHLHLPARRITGNSHMLMMDDNNAEIATMISEWIGRRRSAD